MRPAGPSGGVEEPRARPLGLEPVVDSLHELYQALHKSSIYPFGHPAIRGAIERAAERLSTSLAQRSPIVIGIAKDHLLIDRSPVTEGPASLGSLASYLHGLDVGVVELREGLGPGELERFLFQLREARRNHRRGTSLVLALAEERLRSVRVLPIDYLGLRFSEEADRLRGEGDRSGDLWENLVQTLTGEAPDGLNAIELAEEANRKLADHEGVGAGLLRRHVHAVGQQMQGMEEWQREALRTRMSRFVQALNPGLRRDLLRVDARDSTDSLTVLAELSDSLPDSTLMEALQDLNRKGHQVHDQILNFMNKLGRLAPPGMTETATAEDVLARWGVSAGPIEGEAATLRAALKEVLFRRKTIDCNPDAYQELLSELTHQEMLPVTKELVSRYGDPREPAEIRPHAVEIALVLLQGEGNRAHDVGILGFIGAVTDPLLEAGSFQTVRDALVAARSVCASEGQSEDARKAATAYVREFTLAERVDRILRIACDGQELSCAAEALLAAGGSSTVDRIIDFLEENTEPAVSSALQNLAVNLGGETLSQVLANRAEAGWARLRPALSMVRLLPAAAAVPVLDSLGDHPESRVRKEVLTLHCEIDRSPGSPERYLRRRLADPDPRLASFALQQLAVQTGEESLEMLAAFLEGSVVPAEPTPGHVRRAARALIGREGGTHRLCVSLERLRHRARMRNVRVGSLIRAELLAHRQDRVVARALARWRWSPAGLVSLALFGWTPPEDRE